MMELTQKQRVQILRAAGCKGYDKYLDSKVQRPEKYGVTWTQHAKTALDAVATAQDAQEQSSKGKRTGDRHRHKGRVSARMPRDQVERLQNDVRFCGYGTVQGWIGACANRLAKEADKRRARIEANTPPAAGTKKSPSGTDIPKGAKKNTPYEAYHTGEGFVKCFPQTKS